MKSTFFNKIQFVGLSIAGMIIFSSLQIRAQLFEAQTQIGFSMNQIDGDESAGFSKLGFHIGVVLESSVSRTLFFQTGTNYFGKGSKTNSADPTSASLYRTHLDYVELPFLLRLQLTEKFSFVGGFGVSYLFRAHLFENGYELLPSTYAFKNFDFSYQLGATYLISERWAFKTAIHRSIISIRKDKTWINYSLLVSMNYLLATNSH